MKNAEDSFLTVGQLAGKVSVTVRTLQYYDQTGLLKSSIGKNGRRIYTHSDILKLQPILFFKSFGFSLAEIKQKILHYQTPSDLENLFVEQREILLG